MGKTEKTGLGRALVKQHTNMILQSKEKGRLYKSQLKNVLESITDVNDIDAVIQEAEESDRLLTAAASSATTPHISLDTNSVGDMTLEERKKEEELHAGSLQVPRRPPWTADMKVEELDANEQRSFLVWRRKLAALEDNDKLVLTPFEKNLDIWRQLWRVVERSDLLVMVVDARDPLFYRCPDLEAYAREVDEHKRTLLLVNKADLLPLSVRQKWAEYFMHHEILYVFWSAKAASAALDVKTLDDPGSEQPVQEKVDDDPPHTKIYGRDELLTRLQSEAEEIVKVRMESSSSNRGPSSRAANSPRNVVVGFVGYPNVGKSSTINALVGQKRTGVTSTPGKTKHFQTLIMSEELMLCDCPGLVFPSFSSSRYEMVASGVLPIDRMTEHREAVQVVANRVPRHLIEAVYKIKLPKPKPYEPQSRPPLASELLRSYCASRGWVASSGLPDETRAARLILKDYLEGKLPHYELPPGMSDMEETFVDKTGPSSSELHSDSDESDVEETVDPNVETVPGLEHMMDHLNSFEMENGLTAKKVTSKKANAPHKQHKKPPRKKDRSWRIGKGNEDGDGMPSVRVFQKSTNTGPSNAGMD